jgi:dopamine beta-monooxygenase
MKKGRAAAYKSIEWTLPRINELFTMYTNEPLSMQCNRSDGHRFEGFKWENAPITEVPLQLPQPQPSCSRGGKSLRDSNNCDMFGDCIY